MATEPKEPNLGSGKSKSPKKLKKKNADVESSSVPATGSVKKRKSSRKVESERASKSKLNSSDTNKGAELGSPKKRKSKKSLKKSTTSLTEGKKSKRKKSRKKLTATPADTNSDNEPSASPPLHATQGQLNFTVEEEEEEEESYSEYEGEFFEDFMKGDEQLPAGETIAESRSYNFDPATTEAVYYTTSKGDIINRGVIDDPDFIVPSCSPSEVGYDGEEYGEEYYWLDEDEEEDLRRFMDFLEDRESEQLLTDAEYSEIREGLLKMQRDAMGLEHGFQFEDLDMSGRHLHDLMIVEHFTTLKTLNVSNNSLQDVRGLASFIHLVKLDASRNEITEFLNIYSTQNLPLREVNFSRNNIAELLDLKQFWALTVINLSYNELTSVDGEVFHNCTYLRVLNLSHNRIYEIKNLNCLDLVILLLKFNELTTMEGFEGCDKIRYLNVSNNQITGLYSLKSMPELMEFRCQENNIEDLLELENLNSLIHLSHLCITPNPCLEVGMSRHLLIHMFPQVRYLDGEQITPDEILEAKNTFNPSYLKLSFEDHINTMLEKACQSSNIVFDEFCRIHPIPPIILLVGSSKSNSNKLALLLKERMKHDVLLGGVHSTATTIEGNTRMLEDIPVSYESFSEMRNRGEFLATSHILGRLCGFATSQISRAAEKGAVLVATVPLVTAVCLRKWRLRPKYVLILPSTPPHFNVDQFIQAQMEQERILAEEGRQDFEDENVETRHPRRVSFGNYVQPAGHHTVESATSFLTQATILRHSNDDFNDDDNPEAVRENGDGKRKSSLLNSISPDLSLLGSAFPRYRSGDGLGPEDDYEEKLEVVKPIDKMNNNRPGQTMLESYEEFFGEDSYSTTSKYSKEHGGEYDSSGLWNLPVYCRNPFHLTKESPPFTVTNRLRRLRRLASVLLVQTGENKPPPDYVPDIMMNLPGIEQPLDPDLLESIDWKKSILQNSLYNSLLESDESYYMVLVQATTTDGQPEPRETLRSTLMPRRTVAYMENPNRRNSFPKQGDDQEDGDPNYELRVKLVKDGKFLLGSQGSVVSGGSENEAGSRRKGKKHDGDIVSFSEDSLKQTASLSTESKLKIKMRKKTEFEKTTKKPSENKIYVGDMVSFSEDSFDTAALSAESKQKIKNRKKTEYEKTKKQSNVVFSESNLQNLPSVKDGRSKRSIMTISSKIQNRKPTPTQAGVMTPDASFSGEFPGEYEEFYGEYEDNYFNGNMNYEEEMINFQDDTDNETHKSTSPRMSHRFKHRDAIEQSILKTREEYKNFHNENPGFFSTVLDTADLEASADELEAIAREMLENFRKEVEKAGGQLRKSHAGLNKEGEDSFVKERVEFLKWCNHEWDKGYQHPIQHMKEKFGIDLGNRSSFERKRRPDNVLDPTLPRHHSSAKIRQLIRLGKHKTHRHHEKPKKLPGSQKYDEEEGEYDEGEFEEDLEAFLAGHEIEEGENEIEIAGEGEEEWRRSWNLGEFQTEFGEE